MGAASLSFSDVALDTARTHLSLPASCSFADWLTKHSSETGRVVLFDRTETKADVVQGGPTAPVAVPYAATDAQVRPRLVPWWQRTVPAAP